MNFADISHELTNAIFNNLKGVDNITKAVTPPPYPMSEMFTSTVLREGAVDTTVHAKDAVLAFKQRNIGDRKDKAAMDAMANLMAKGLRLFTWKDYPSKKSLYPRYFLVWLSPRLKGLIQEGQKEIPLSIFLHPVGEIGTNEGNYYKEDNSIDSYYLKVGIDYVLNGHYLMQQHCFAVKKDSQLANLYFHIPICLVFPIFSGSAHSLFPKYDAIHFLDIMEGLVQSAIPQYFTSYLQPKLQLTLGRVAISAFSLGGILLRRLFVNPKEERLKKINEVYAFDCVMNDAQTSKQKAYEEFWSHLKVWQGDDSQKMIRLYSAEVSTVSNILAELEANLKKYRGGKLIKGQFRKFDGVKVEQHVYKFPDTDVELHSTDSSRILVLIPMTVFHDYGYGVKNPQGIQIWIGHAWFPNMMMTHALYHSSF